MREIPSLRILALRAVGPIGCNPELTFGGPRARKSRSADDSDSDTEDGEVKAPQRNKRKGGIDEVPIVKNPTMTSRSLRSLRDSELPQKPYSGPCRPNANDVDISHPWIMTVYPPRDPPNNAPLITANETENEASDATTNEFLAIENSNRAMECIQVFIDALVESGRASDSRMGVHFFREWVTTVTGEDAADIAKRVKAERSKKKRKKNEAKREPLPLGSLSLHNFAPGSIQTFQSMERANVGSCLGTLDITGVHGLTDSILTNILCSGSFSRIRRLSLKNCRKVTGKGIASLVKLTRLCALDVGGCFNIQPNDVVSLVQRHPSTKKGRLTEIYASGLGWTDPALEELIDATAGHLRGLGVGFSPHLSGSSLILTLSKVGSTLDRLALPFCPGVDEAVATALCTKLPNLAVLDIRGSSKVYSLSGMMEGRGGLAAEGHLFVLARYSGISNNSLEETMRLYESRRLTCFLDGGGVGGGIRR